MHFRTAPWALLALAPVIGIAFWPSYFGDLANASLAFHAHGLTAMAWLGLVAFQSLSAHWRDRRWHRRFGRAVFLVVPLFAGAAVLVMHSMATKFATGSHPFYAVLGARLGLHDLVSTTVLVAMVCVAFILRRKPALHGGFMLATALLVLPPVIARLPIPRFFHSGEVIAIALSAVIAWRSPAARGPFLVVIAVQLLQIALFETLGASGSWAGAFVAFSEQSVWPYAATAVLAAGLALLWAWTRVPPRSSSTPSRPLAANSSL